MKFMQGMIVGGIVATGVTLMYTNNSYKPNPRKMMKRGKQFVRKIGLI